MVAKFLDQIKSKYRKVTHPYRRWFLFKKSPVIKDKVKSHASYSGKYVLTIEPLDMGKGHWQYTRGTIKTKSGKKIAIVERNYSSFPFAFVENHPDGHDYLICGENYQGQTIIQLDTGKRVDYLPDAASQGHGFCWIKIHPSPDGLTLAVEGCYWGSPYEIRFVDFSKPMMCPFPQFSHDESYDEFGSWVSPTEAKITRSYEVSTVHGKQEHEMSAKELTELCDHVDAGNEMWKEVVDEVVWKRP